MEHHRGIIRQYPPCDRDIVKGSTYSYLLHLVTRNEVTSFTLGFKLRMRLVQETMISTSDITDPK